MHLLIFIATIFFENFQVSYGNSKNVKIFVQKEIFTKRFPHVAGNPKLN